MIKATAAKIKPKSVGHFNQPRGWPISVFISKYSIPITEGLGLLGTSIIFSEFSVFFDLFKCLT